ncbi:MAG: NosD domain-containing protein [Nanoarchaeota archaeon]
MKKKVLLLILSLILLTFMVLSDVSTDPLTTYYNVSNSLMDKWVPAGGTGYLFNFTINLTSTEGNITSINITVPNGFNVTQGTNQSSLPAGWLWTNKSNSILIVNTTDGIGNKTFYIWANFTADPIKAETATTWYINFSTATGNSTTTSFTGGGIDNLAPRFLGGNVSDGVITCNIQNTNCLVDGNTTNLTFAVTFNETNNNASSAARLCWNTTAFTTLNGINCTNSTNMTRAGSNLYTLTFPRHLNIDETNLYFIFWVEDMLGNKIWINNSELPFNISSRSGPLQCGSTIYEDTVLTEDLLDCPDYGLIIGTNNITLDCDGHLIDGVVRLDYWNWRPGIYVEYKKEINIINCVVTDFQSGINLYSSNNSFIFNNTLHNNGNGTVLEGRWHGDNNIIMNNLIFNNEKSILLKESSNNNLSGNIFINNSLGLSLIYASNNTFWNNQFIEDNITAYENYLYYINNWNLSDVGNYWGDFESNPGYPYYYEVPGPGNGTDWHPVNGIINFPPNITSIPITTATERELYTYDVEAEDPYNDTLFYYLVNYPPGMIINNGTGLIEWAPYYNQSGEHNVTVSVTDSYFIDTQAYTIYVENVNRLPVLDIIENQESNEGEMLTIDLNATDLDNEPLTYYTNAGDVLSSAFTFNQNNGLFKWNATFYDQGSYNITFNVTDGEDWDEQTITIDVTNVLATDLYLTNNDISFSDDTPRRDQTIYITAVFYNNLEINPEEILVEFYNGPKGIGTYIGSDLVTTERTDTYFAQTDWIAETGIHNIYVYLDPNQETGDIDYTNNMAFKQITVIVLPDMMVRTQDIGFSNPEPQEGEEINILAMIHNVEDIPSGDFNVLFYLDDQSNVISEQILNLEGDNTELLIVPWTAVIGDHTIYVKVDYDYQVCEQDETNNEGLKLITVVYETPECNDGTPSGTCADSPLYCDGGTLVNNCHECGCPGYQRCLPNGNCGKKVLVSRVPDPI